VIYFLCPIGYIQATGEARYTDDIPNPSGGLYGSYVYSTVVTGTISSIDASVAMTMPGVVAFISAKDVADIGAANDCGAFPGDEEIFASSRISW
jgi:xanthine dehydrogenase molybdopterin-binding subunit B